MKNIIKKILLTTLGIVAFIVIIGGAAWLIDGRSPHAIIISHLFDQATLEEYDQRKGDKTDQTTVEIPDNVKFPREMREYRVDSMQGFHMEPQDDSKPIVLYIHGGAYYHNFSSFHWNAMSEWAKETGCGIVAPNYPLLYCYTASDAHPVMMKLYQQLVEKYTGKRLIIMGDSAGGGFTLALAQEARNDSIDMPAHLVLISPWVDVLGGDDALQEKEISPLYGDMQGLPPTDLYTGTWEIFYTDIVKTYDKMKAAGVDAQLHVAEKLGHVYALWPCPEGSKARKEIAQTILQ